MAVRLRSLGAQLANEPVVQRQAGAASGSLRGFAGFVANAFDAPRKAKSHAHTEVEALRVRIDSRGTGAR